MLRHTLTWLVLIGFVGIAGVCLAQGAPPAGDPSVEYKKKTVYDFEDDLVEGELQRPDGEFIDVRRKARHSSLIKIREDFVPEMLKSAEDI